MEIYTDSSDVDVYIYSYYYTLCTPSEFLK